MKDIFQANGRVEQKNGLHFYEQDIVMLDYLYSGDIIIEMIFDYNSPGFGLVFDIGNNSKLSEEPSKAIVAKFGDLDFSVYQMQFKKTKRLYFESCLLSADKKEHKVLIKKSGAYLYAYEVIDDREIKLAAYRMKNNIPYFHIGIYSNHGNTVKQFNVYDKRPRFWFTNINNTNGGRICFSQSRFEVACAENDVEIIQKDIHLPKGRYFLSYETEAIDEILDVKSFIFNSTDNHIFAPEKSLLKYDEKEYGNCPYFDVKEDNQKFDLLFQCNSGSISKISIKDDYRQSYVSNDSNEIAEIDSSCIKFNLKKLKKIEIEGVIEEIPLQKLQEALNYAIYEYNNKKHSIDELFIQKNKSYSYVFERKADLWQLIISEGSQIKTITESFGDEWLRFFENISGYIDKLIVTDLNDVKTDILHQKTIKKYVPADIQSPIIVTDENNQPLDLSASYRKLNNGKYYFTNWEREIFLAENEVILNSSVYNATDLIVYGIRGEINTNKIYCVKDEMHINMIDLCVEHYDKISSDMFVLTDEQVVFDSELKGKYTYYIIDYLKAESYAINPTESGGEYEVDIAYNGDIVNVMYDMAEDGKIRSYKKLEIPIEDNPYIVLRKNEVTN